ncbi:MAG TPA: hypothetical protein VK762_21945 [Polyangiaceae bacterium]|jgi:hypothetical protein|nr:hypothetical protein [Polyangiaceae bacterium]
MNFTALRSPYRPRTIVSSGAGGHVRDASLRRAIVVTRTVIATLCGARAGSDWLRGQATFEGGIAVVLLVVFTVWLATEAIGREIRDAIPVPGDTPYRSSMRPGTS